MSNIYKTIETSVLRKMWERERDRLAGKKDAVVSDYDDLYAMRQELERRSGRPLPYKDVNFESYVTK